MGRRKSLMPRGACSCQRIFHGYGIVDACAQAAHQAMALDLIWMLGRSRDKGQRRRSASPVRKVTLAMERLSALPGAMEELAVLEQVIEQIGLILSFARPWRKSAGLLDPVEDLAAHVDAKGVGRVEHGAPFGLGLKVQVRGASAQRPGRRR